MLEPGIRELAQGANYCIVTSVMPDGDVQALPLWVDCDDAGEHLLINTEVHRQRYKNVKTNPKVTVLLLEDGNWYGYAEVRGHLVGEVRGQEARDHIDALSRKYQGHRFCLPPGLMKQDASSEFNRIEEAVRHRRRLPDPKGPTVPWCDMFQLHDNPLVGFSSHRSPENRQKPKRDDESDSQRSAAGNQTREQKRL